MKSLSGSISFVLLLATACTPKNEEVRTEQINTKNVEAAADSAVTTRKDGTATTHTIETPKLPVPQPVLQRLTEKYPEWREPVFLNEATQSASGKEQGPLLVKGDFNGDGMQDIALQIRHKRDLVVVAALQDSGSWQLHELKRDILFNDRGTYKTLYYVYLTDAGSKVYNYESRQYITTANDAVSVGIDNSSTTYVYEAGNFKAYDTAD